MLSIEINIYLSTRKLIIINTYSIKGHNCNTKNLITIFLSLKKYQLNTKVINSY